MRSWIGGLALAALVIPAATTTAARADDPAYVMVGAGSWETFRDANRGAEVDLAYRSNYKLWFLKPHAGVLVASDGDFFGYAGLLADIYWGSHIVTTLSTSVGTYGGHGYDLGSHVAFRSGVDVAWRFPNTARLGVGLYHLSNAGITQRNPGSESLLLTYSYPIGTTGH